MPPSRLAFVRSGRTEIAERSHWCARLPRRSEPGSASISGLRTPAASTRSSKRPIRLMMRLRSCCTWTRMRMSSRSRRSCRPGAKLPFSNPYCRYSARRRTSMRSVFLPCNAGSVAGFTSIRLSPGPSRTCHTGIQHTPMDSTTTCLTPCCLSHLRSRRRSWVNVPTIASSNSTSELPFN